MRGARALVALAIACAIVATGLTGTAAAQEGGKALRLGWAQEPQTLNPFVDQDEEDFRIWALNYDLLVNFSPDDVSPAPGIAESWKVYPAPEPPTAVNWKL